ncbi:MAG: DUF6880 family protein [Sphaerochaeta sp.]
MANQYEKRLKEVRLDFFSNLANKVSSYSKDENGSGKRDIGSTRFKHHQTKQALSSPEDLDKGLSEAYARALRTFLEEIASQGRDPATCLELLTQLYETDNLVFSDATDDEGLLAEIYIRDANELFIQYAASFADKEKLACLVMRIIISDRYGVRSTIAENAQRFLGEPEIRMLIEVLQRLVRKEEDSHAQFNYLYLINSFARQIEDHVLSHATLEKLQNHVNTLYKR